ncbi:DUF2975 domain-containing protein [Streptomyces sp. NPDC058221]|uniref:DUF2975 domain-containing protein n=1 Tax=Streptomyces sp. NPDC058221 TaxID=3346388 RepID=UPI0036EAFE84
MDTRLTRFLARAAHWLTVLSGVAFVGKAASRLLDDGDVCVETGFWANATLGNELPVVRGVQGSGTLTRLCQEHPSGMQRLGDIGAQLPWYLFAFVALLLFSRLLGNVVEQGPFVAATAQRLRTLGWFVAVGAPLTALASGWSQSALVGSMAPVAGSGPILDWPWPLLLTGLTAVIMGQAMREGARMREDLEGTI